MPSEPLVIDPSDLELKEKVSTLRATPGYCIFIDVVGSTEMKQAGIHRWVALIHNCFSDANSFFSKFPPLKGIGDELMYYIEEADMNAAGESALQIYDALYQIAANRSTDYPETKICAAYCCSAYPITFLKGVRDFYGIDIDRTARLKTKLDARQVVIDSRMYGQVKSSYDLMGNANKDQFKSFTKLAEAAPYIAKGIPDPIQFYRANAA